MERVQSQGPLGKAVPSEVCSSFPAQHSLPRAKVPSLIQYDPEGLETAAKLCCYSRCDGVTWLGSVVRLWLRDSRPRLWSTPCVCTSEFSLWFLSSQSTLFSFGMLQVRCHLKDSLFHVCNILKTAWQHEMRDPVSRWLDRCFVYILRFWAGDFTG